MAIARDMKEILSQLCNPAHDCSQAPFWFWNGPLDATELSRQILTMAEQGVHAAMPHPRFGMDRRQYLEPPFWKAMRATIAEARASQTQIILYDEYNWPSGGAGGRVTDGHPEYYPRGLDYHLRDIAGPISLTITEPEPGEPESGHFERILAAFLVPSDCPMIVEQLSSTDNGLPANAEVRPWGAITADGRSVTGDIPSGQHRVMVFFQAYGRNPSLLDSGSAAFIDYMQPAATKRFIALTHEAYRRRFAADFGKTITSIFCDEPSVICAGPFPWTDAFAKEFRRRRGYDLIPHLVALCDDRYRNGSRHRAAYWQTVSELFHDAFLAPIGAWCRKNGIALTGHLLDENLDSWMCSPNLMQSLRQFDWPGLDALGTHATPAGCKIPVSVAHLTGKPHIVCEALGLAGGWNATLGMARRGYQYLAVMGVDLLVPHAFFQTMDNPRVECPPSYFHQNPYWKYYATLATLTSRLCAFNRIGIHAAPVALYYPIESLWADGTGGRGRGNPPWATRRRGNAWAQKTVSTFNDVLQQLSASPLDCDVVDAEALRGATVLPDGSLSIGPERFSALILPTVRTLPPEAWSKAEEFVVQGGILVLIGQWPESFHPAPAGGPDRVREFAARPQNGNCQRHGKGTVLFLETTDNLSRTLMPLLNPTAVFPAGRPEALCLLTRRTDDATLWLFVNDESMPLTVDVILPTAYLPRSCQADGCGRLEAFDPLTGKSTALKFTADQNGWHTTFSLADTAATIVIAAPELEKTSAQVESESNCVTEHETALGDWTIQLVPSGLDTVWSAQAMPEWCDLPVWRMHDRGWEAMRGWETPDFDDHEWLQVAALRGAAQSHDRSVLLRTALPPGATHLRHPLPVTGEYVLFINGQLLERRLGPPPKEGEIDISRLVRGRHDMIAMEVASESDLAGLSAPLQVRCGPATLDRLEEWKALGLWWYAGRARYRTVVHMDAPHKIRHAQLDLGTVGHYAEVWVNGQLAGTLLWRPYTLEIGQFLRQGENEIVVIVSNSLASRFLWDQWGNSRCGRSWGVPSQPETSGLVGPVIIRH